MKSILTIVLIAAMFLSCNNSNAPKEAVTIIDSASVAAPVISPAQKNKFVWHTYKEVIDSLELEVSVFDIKENVWDDTQEKFIHVDAVGHPETFFTFRNDTCYETTTKVRLEQLSIYVARIKKHSVYDEAADRWVDKDRQVYYTIKETLNGWMEVNCSILQ